MLRIFMAPVTVPGRLTLQADRANWLALQRLLLLSDQPAHDELDILLKQHPDDGIIRLTMDDARARMLLGIAGLSA